MYFDINWIAVLVATVIAMAIGAAWYSPLLFANHWMKLAKVHQNQTKNSMGKALGVAFVATFVSATVLAIFIGYAGAFTFIDGAMVGFWAGIGIAATTLMIHDIFEGRPHVLTLMNAAHQTVILTVMGALIAAWS